MSALRLPRDSKYHNERVAEDGYTFDSKAEAKEYRKLASAARAGTITDLCVHPRYPLRVNGVLVCTYVADFEYRENGQRVVMDVKSEGTITPVYKLKRKLMLAVHGITISEVMA